MWYTFIVYSAHVGKSFNCFHSKFNTTYMYMLLFYSTVKNTERKEADEKQVKVKMKIQMVCIFFVFDNLIFMQ